MIHRAEGHAPSEQGVEPSYAEIEQSRIPRILVVNHTSSMGGAELGLLRFLASCTDFQVDVLVLENGELTDSLRAAGINVISPHGARGACKIGFTAQVVRTLNDRKYDMVISNSMRAATISAALLLRSTPHVYYLQDGLGPESLSRIKRSILRIVTLPKVDYFLVNSEWTASTIPAHFSAKPTRLVYTMSGGAARAPVGSQSPDSLLSILSLSRIAPWKGIHVLVAAFEFLQSKSNVHIGRSTIAGGSFFGEESYRDSIAARLRRIDIDVAMPGHLSSVGELLHSHDVLVHCSVKPEPFGQVLVQGMAAGLVVIATREGGPSEIIEDGVSGFLYESGDARELANLMERLANDPQLRARVAASAIERAEDFNDERVAALTASSISELLSLKATAGRRGSRQFFVA
jgi:glycosyltransferase involved in cell wall biosynthesis